MKLSWYIRKVFSSLTWPIFALFWMLDEKAPRAWILAFIGAALLEKAEEIWERLEEKKR